MIRAVDSPLYLQGAWSQCAQLVLAAVLAASLLLSFVTQQSDRCSECSLVAFEIFFFFMISILVCVGFLKIDLYNYLLVY